MTVTGANSAWNNTGDLTVGAGGIGTLSLVDGGSVSAGGLISIGENGFVGGNGTLAGNTQNSGTITPGQPVGTIAVVGGYSQAASGKLEIELAGTAAGLFDVVAVTAAATLDGTLDVTLDNAFVPQLGNTFNILTATGVTGRFAAAELPGLPTGRMWQLRYAVNAATLAVALAGDYNDNGLVDTADYVVWRELLGKTLDPRADGDTNGVVNAADYAIWRANFGATAGSGAAIGLVPGVAEVPEPATTATLFAALGLLVGFGRRRVGSRVRPPLPRALYTSSACCVHWRRTARPVLRIVAVDRTCGLGTLCVSRSPYQLCGSLSLVRAAGADPISG